MKTSIAAEKVPLVTDADGVIRVSKTRVTLDTIVAAYADGASSEEIVERYSALRLADVYTVIGYFLHHRAEVDSYLQKRWQAADKVQKENEARNSPIGIRERLLARRRTG